MADLGHLPPTWFRSPGRGQAWHFGPARPNRGRIAPCGIGLPSVDDHPTQAKLRWEIGDAA